jgi:hypothetical protein
MLRPPTGTPLRGLAGPRANQSAPPLHKGRSWVLASGNEWVIPSPRRASREAHTSTSLLLVNVFCLC